MEHKEKPKGPSKKIECIGGVSFLILVIGIFCLLPGTILTGIYVRESIGHFRAIAVILLCVSLSCFITGIALCVFWCVRRQPSMDLVKHCDSEAGKKDDKKRKEPLTVAATTSKRKDSSVYVDNIHEEISETGHSETVFKWPPR